MKVDVSGLNEIIKELDTMDKSIKVGTRRGLVKSSIYLRDKIKERFGTYQASGGDGGGPWKRLLYATVVRKRKKGYGTSANSPLVKTGKLRESIKNRINRAGTEASIYSNDTRLKYHVYGAPRMGVPKRDPMKITTKEEQENVIEIFKEELLDEISKGI